MTNEKKKNDSLRTPRFLGCYVTLAKPRPGPKGEEPSYSIAMLFDKKADLTAIKAAIEEVAVEKWGPNAKLLLGKKLKTPLRDGDEKVLEGGDENYKGKLFINAKSKQRPAIVDTNMQPVDPNDVYSGCFFHATVRFYPYDQNGNKGIGCGLQNLMLVHRGPRIDGRKSAEVEFKDFKPDTEGLPSEDLGDML